MWLPAQSYTYGILAPSDLASVEPRSGNQNAKQKRTLAPAGFTPVVPMFGSRNQVMSVSMVADSAAPTSKPSVRRREAGGAVLAGWRSVSFWFARPPVPRHEAGGAAQCPKPDTSATPSEKSAVLKSSQKNNIINVC